VARRDWIAWITSGKKAETRAKRIGVACDKLASGQRRACCFDRSGMYSKSMSAPVAAEQRPSAACRLTACGGRRMLCRRRMRRGKGKMGTHRTFREAAALLVLCFAGLVQAAPTVGEPSPVDLLGTTPDGEQIRISEHRGKVLVVSFWASWCGYCRKPFPLLDHVQAS